MKATVGKPCKQCGKITQNNSGYCSQCNFNHGTIWILDEETWTWTKEERGEK